MTKLAPLSILAATSVLLAAACGSDSTTTSAEPVASAAAPAAFDLPQGNDPVDLDPTDFTLDIDNPYWPMQPGSQWRYLEVDPDGTELEVVVTVTTETKQIANGVTARIVRDTVTQDGELIEDTFDWYAQDSAGNIWYLGEDTAEFENGEVTSTAGSFEAGVDGALPGIAIPGDAADGMQYRQEFYEGEAEDNGEVLSIDEQVDVPFGHFDGVLLTKDTITIEPDILEYKLYAPKVGLVMALGISGGGGREQLIDFGTVSDATAKAAATTPLGESYE
jgi:hypothetical protein